MGQPSKKGPAMTESTRPAAIPTTYAGVNFRSMLEARWAAMFDALKWDWGYEPFELDGYIPDFTIRWLTNDVLVEVKPARCFDDLTTHEALRKINRSGWTGPALLLGAYPDLHGNGVTPNGYTIFGHLTRDDDWDTDASLIKCLHCGQLTLNTWTGNFTCINCGHHDGDHHFHRINSENVKLLWRKAGNSVQWRPRRRQAIHPRHNEWERGY